MILHTNALAVPLAVTVVGTSSTLGMHVGWVTCRVLSPGTVAFRCKDRILKEGGFPVADEPAPDIVEVEPAEELAPGAPQAVSTTHIPVDPYTGQPLEKDRYISAEAAATALPVAPAVADDRGAWDDGPAALPAADSVDVEPAVTVDEAPPKRKRGRPRKNPETSPPG